MGGKSGSGVVGYWYSFAIHMGISRGPVNELVQINVGDKAAWPTRLVPSDAPPPTDEEVFNALTEIKVNAASGMQYLPPVDLGYNEFSVGRIGMLFVHTRVPRSWQAGHWVKLTGFTRTLYYGGPSISVDGVYRIVGNVDQGTPSEGSLVSQLQIEIPDAMSGLWTGFSTAGADPNTEVTITRVADEFGTPLPDPNTPPVVDPLAGRVFSSQAISVDAPNLFGGEDAEGGVQGSLEVMMGEPTQVAPQSLVNMHGEPLPGYRRMFTAFFDGKIAAMNPYPKAWRFRVRRTTQGWDGAPFLPNLATVVMNRPLREGEVAATGEIHAMNPAHIIYECLTNREWGRGLPESAINVPSFVTAAGTLFSEAFGLCLRWTRTDSIESFVQGVLDHIGATLYQDPTTALLTLKLIRGGYKIEDLPLFEPGKGLLTVSDAPVAAAGSYVNAVRVTWHDPIHDQEQTVTVHNLASIQASGGTFNMVSKNYSGIPTASLAERVAQRDLQTLGIELRKLTVVLDRSAHKVRPGDVIRVRDPSRSIRETLLRVASYDDGTMTNGAITVVGVQDVFDLPPFGYTNSQGGGWVPPTTRACIGRHEVFELPYIFYAATMTPADLDYVTPESGRLGTVVEQGQSGNVAYKIAVRDGAPEPEDAPLTDASFCGYVPPTT
jgi:hypothetical protein